MSECRIATTPQLTAMLLGAAPDWLDTLDPTGRHALVPLGGQRDVKVRVRAMLKQSGSPDPLVVYPEVDWGGYFALPEATLPPAFRDLPDDGRYRLDNY
jgi:hypothetical protein